MAKINIQIELNENDIDKLLNETEECNCGENDLIDCIKDELDWDTKFYERFYEQMSREARAELFDRILEAKKQYNEYTEKQTP